MTTCHYCDTGACELHCPICGDNLNEDGDCPCLFIETERKRMQIRDRKWFLDRIGKRIYRNADSCTCETCKDVVENGLIVHDAFHAQYLYDLQMDYAAEGTLLRYRDEK